MVELIGGGAPAWDSPPMRKCEFCGCNTNAFVRKCCDKGHKADIDKNKEKKLSG